MFSYTLWKKINIETTTRAHPVHSHLHNMTYQGPIEILIQAEFLQAVSQSTVCLAVSHECSLDWDWRNQKSFAWHLHSACMSMRWSDSTMIEDQPTAARHSALTLSRRPHYIPTFKEWSSSAFFLPELSLHHARRFLLVSCRGINGAVTAEKSFLSYIYFDHVFLQKHPNQ